MDLPVAMLFFTCISTEFFRLLRHGHRRGGLIGIPVPENFDNPLPPAT
jgi:hypothetical protein